MDAALTDAITAEDFETTSDELVVNANINHTLAMLSRPSRLPGHRIAGHRLLDLPPIAGTERNFGGNPGRWTIG
jgi:hypothetical protein